MIDMDNPLPGTRNDPKISHVHVSKKQEFAQSWLEKCILGLAKQYMYKLEPVTSDYDCSFVARLCPEAPAMVDV